MTGDRLSEHDQKRNEDPSVAGGAVGGATGAGVGASLGVAALGPLGLVLGALAGAAGGWWAGKGVVESVEDVDRSDNRFRRAHEHAGATRPYEEVRHAYQLGYLAARNPDYSDATFEETEEDLRAAWVQAHVHDPEPVPWEDVRASARTGFDLGREEA
ncbi:MAG: hypothetical protein WD737_06300 [Gemmatimonadota bacterium]